MGQSPIPMVSAFAACQNLVLGQVKVADKSNQIVATPKLLALLAIAAPVCVVARISRTHVSRSDSAFNGRDT